MEANQLPAYDRSDNPTHCCPRFNPDGWDNQELHFDDKLFVKATTRSVLHIPLNMADVFSETFAAIEDANAGADDTYLVLSSDPSAWKGEHLFAVTKPVPDHEMVRLSGDFLTQVFEGPFRNMEKWRKTLNATVAARGQAVKKTHFFYTTCPSCAKSYGKNYVVGIAELKPATQGQSAFN